MKKSCPEKEGHPPAESTEKIVDPFARANSARTCSDCLVLTELTQLVEPKCLYGETLGNARRVTLPSLKSEPARWVIDHGRLYETEQQSAIFKAMFILYCIRLAMSVF